jgi:hypothetical protein
VLWNQLRRTFEASADDDVRDNTQIAHCENVIETSGLFDSQSQNGYSAKLDEQNHNKTVKRITGICKALSCTCQSEDETESEEIRIGRQELDAHAEMFSEIVSHGVAQQLINVSTVASSHTART